MKIYVDVNEDFGCSAEARGGCIELDEAFFDGKCDEFIAGYALKPIGYSLDDCYSDVKMIYPRRDYSELHRAQLEHELELSAAERQDMLSALSALGVSADD